MIRQFSYLKNLFSLIFSAYFLSSISFSLIEMSLNVILLFYKFYVIFKDSERNILNYGDNILCCFIILLVCAQILNMQI